MFVPFCFFSLDDDNPFCVHFTRRQFWLKLNIRQTERLSDDICRLGSCGISVMYIQLKSDITHKKGKSHYVFCTFNHMPEKTDSTCFTINHLTGRYSRSFFDDEIVCLSSLTFFKRISYLYTPTFFQLAYYNKYMECLSVTYVSVKRSLYLNVYIYLQGKLAIKNIRFWRKSYDRHKRISK